ncbi:MAG: hypothetical protein ACUZ8N_16815 [Candidatus Scalindua sp.]
MTKILIAETEGGFPACPTWFRRVEARTYASLSRGFQYWIPLEREDGCQTRNSEIPESLNP